MLVQISGDERQYIVLDFPCSGCGIPGNSLQFHVSVGIVAGFGGVLALSTAAEVVRASATRHSTRGMIMLVRGDLLYC